MLGERAQPTVYAGRAGGSEQCPGGRAGPQHPSRTTQLRGITSEIPAAGRSFWRRSRPRRCCTPAATGSQHWSRCGARTRQMRSALQGWSRRVSGTQHPGGSPHSHPPGSRCLTAAQLVTPLGAVDDAIAAHGAVLAALSRLLVHDAGLRPPEHNWKQVNAVVRLGLPAGACCGRGCCRTPGRESRGGLPCTGTLPNTRRELGCRAAI